MPALCGIYEVIMLAYRQTISTKYYTKKNVDNNSVMCYKQYQKKKSKLVKLSKKPWKESCSNDTFKFTLLNF